MNTPDENMIEIIDVPEAKTLSHKISDYSVTAIMWVLWLYLLLPFINVVLWAVGLQHFYDVVITTTTAADILALMNTAGWYILAVFLTLRIWGLYNYWAFGKHDNRKANEVSAIYGLARFHGIPPNKILALQERKEIVWPMYRSIHPDKDVEDWLEGVSKRNVSPIKDRAEESASDEQNRMEIHLPPRHDDTQRKSDDAS